jgi:hypothetical protein
LQSLLPKLRFLISLGNEAFHAKPPSTGLCKVVEDFKTGFSRNPTQEEKLGEEHCLKEESSVTIALANSISPWWRFETTE